MNPYHHSCPNPEVTRLLIELHGLRLGLGLGPGLGGIASGLGGIASGLVRVLDKYPAAVIRELLAILMELHGPAVLGDLAF